MGADDKEEEEEPKTSAPIVTRMPIDDVVDLARSIDPKCWVSAQKMWDNERQGVPSHRITFRGTRAEEYADQMVTLSGERGWSAIRLGPRDVLVDPLPEFRSVVLDRELVGMGLKKV